VAKPIERIDTPTSPFVVLEASFVHLGGDFVGEEVEHPEKEYKE
jgi:hypothetical protein